MTTKLCRQVSDYYLLGTVIIPVYIDNAYIIITFVADKGGPTVHINGILGEIVRTCLTCPLAQVDKYVGFFS